MKNSNPFKCEFVKESICQVGEAPQNIYAEDEEWYCGGFGDEDYRGEQCKDCKHWFFNSEWAKEVAKHEKIYRDERTNEDRRLLTLSGSYSI